MRWMQELHWDVPEYQDTGPEATLIHLSPLQKITVSRTHETELLKFKGYILSALSLFQSVVQIRKIP